MKKFSIIIPVYNATFYIKKCLTSIVDQKKFDLNEVEVIIVNDASTDDSLEHIDIFLKENPKLFHLYENEINKGVSFTRNFGLDKANGEFVIFLDADDYLSENYLAESLKIIKKYNSTFITNNVYVQENNQKIFKYYADDYELREINNMDKEFSIFPFLASSVIKKDFLIENNIKYDKKISIGEDSIIRSKIYNINPIFHTALKAKYIMVKRDDEKSAMQSAQYKKKSFLELAEFAKLVGENKYLNLFAVERLMGQLLAVDKYLKSENEKMSNSEYQIWQEAAYKIINQFAISEVFKLYKSWCGEKPIWEILKQLHKYNLHFKKDDILNILNNKIRIFNIIQIYDDGDKTFFKINTFMLEKNKLLINGQEIIAQEKIVNFLNLENKSEPIKIKEYTFELNQKNNIIEIIIDNKKVNITKNLFFEANHQVKVINNLVKTKQHDIIIKDQKIIKKKKNLLRRIIKELYFNKFSEVTHKRGFISAILYYLFLFIIRQIIKVMQNFKINEVEYKNDNSKYCLVYNNQKYYQGQIKTIFILARAQKINQLNEKEIHFYFKNFKLMQLSDLLIYK